ncbi:MAG: hypothetical protein RLZZ139_93 [Cyanobacteriota bacterium]|jgi:Uma2 family endonuclease
MRSPIHNFSVAEYLEAESKSEVRHEYLGGQVFAMDGGSKAHNIITLNIILLVVYVLCCGVTLAMFLCRI